MRLFTFIVFLFFSLPVLALGPEEQEFIGISGKRKITLGYMEDPNVYGAKVPGLLKCFNEREQIICEPEKQGRSGVVYVKAPADATPQFKRARQLYKKLYPTGKVGSWNPKGVYADHFWVCQKGCTTEIPELFILITHGD